MTIYFFNLCRLVVFNCIYISNNVCVFLQFFYVSKRTLLYHLKNLLHVNFNSNFLPVINFSFCSHTVTSYILLVLFQYLCKTTTGGCLLFNCKNIHPTWFLIPIVVHSQTPGSLSFFRSFWLIIHLVQLIEKILYSIHNHISAQIRWLYNGIYFIRYKVGVINLRIVQSLSSY